MKDKLNYKLINTLVVLVIFYVIYLLKGFGIHVLSTTLNILKPFVIGFALAYAFYPFVRALKERKIPKTLSVIFLLVILLLLIVFLVFSVLPLLTSQLTSLAKNLYKFLTNIDGYFDINLSSVKNALLSYSNTIIHNAGNYISNGALTLINVSINFVSNFVISLVAFIYFLFSMDKIRENIKLLCKRRSKKFNNLIRELDHGMSNYFKGLLLCIVIQFIEYTVIFYLIGHPNFLLLGVICSVSSIIPYFGGIAANVVAVVTASVVSPQLLIFTLIVAFVCPNIDGYIISPRVYGKTNQLSPIVSIFAVFAGGVLGGFVGILISLPIAIMVQIIYRTYRKEIIEKISEEIKK